MPGETPSRLLTDPGSRVCVASQFGDPDTEAQSKLIEPIDCDRPVRPGDPIHLVHVPTADRPDQAVSTATVAADA